MRLRRFIEPFVLVVAAGAMLIAVQATGGRSTPAAEPSPALSAAPRAAVAHLRLLVPQAALPGERITVLAYRNSRLCGAVDLRFDGAPVVHHLASYVGADGIEMFLTLDVPARATPGSHEIELYGPVPGGRSGPICADVREHQAELAATTITVASRRGELRRDG